MRNRMLVAVAVSALFLSSPALAQGVPYTPNFQGVGPSNTTDFSNPPISFGRQGGFGFAEVVPFGSVAYGSLGNATTYVSATVYHASIAVASDMTITNINCLNGGTVGTNSVIYALYNSGGLKIAQTANAGTATAGANAFQTIALTAPIAIQGPAVYLVSVQANGAIDNLRTIAASTFVNAKTGSATGVFGALPTITFPTTFTANVGPLCYIN